MEARISLDLQELRRLLSLFDNKSGGQQSQDQRLWLKIKEAEERLERRYDDPINGA